MADSTSVALQNPCPWCGPAISHCGGPCPRVRSIEYWPDGTIKRVEFAQPGATVPTVLGEINWQIKRG